ncbi:helix-turn-helix domain-containing protein [Desulfitobacterium sp.]|uniref:helix-turn-helix domain-containing protein n=1 Tax=Desulfitobacterium sp. TaxID=49981 RepID=UPI002D0F606C|nr:helix-turn-helix domain-containing protein [Desulfitobacterium sp.]HVJ50102.1 helix-turn-helix domain-containing protein [Desulfitobacterium sp.]
MDYAQLDFETLWQFLDLNDQQALAELLVRFEPLIRSESKLHGRIDEDIAQDIREAFIRALKKNPIKPNLMSKTGSSYALYRMENKF